MHLRVEERKTKGREMMRRISWLFSQLLVLVLGEGCWVSHWTKLPHCEIFYSKLRCDL